MYGMYAHPGDADEDSLTTSGSFNVASLVGSAKPPRFGRGMASENFRPVRMGPSSGKKSGFGPRRAVDLDTKHGVSNLNMKLAAISEDGPGDKKTEDRDVSLSDVLCSLELNTPAQTRKTSPDSGSFTMEASYSEQREVGGADFTDSLPRQNPNLPRPVRMKVARSGLKAEGPPVRLKMSEAARTRLEDPTARTRLDPSSFRTPHGKENFPSGLKSLHSLASHSLNQSAAPQTQKPLPVLTSQSSEQLAATPAAAVLLQTPQPVTSLQHRTPAAAPAAVEPAPVPHVGTPLPGAGAAAMPPPVAAKAKEYVLQVRGRNYRVMKLLGKGGSSRVYEAFDEEKNMVVAIKRVDLSDVDEAQREEFVNEIDLLRQLQGEDRIIKLHDYEKVVGEEEDLLYVVMEKGDTDLASLIKKYTIKKEITAAMIKHYWSEMLHAVAVIHQKGVIHKDLKPANFMLVAGTLKLIDFGIAKCVQSDMTSVIIDNPVGTFNYMSPESIQDLNGPQFDKEGKKKPGVKISFKSDVWSLGCILYHLTYGKLPFADIKYPLQKLQAISNSNHHIPFPERSDLDPRLVEVIKSCLERDVSRRASVEELLSHSFLREEAPAAPAATKSAVHNLKMLEALEGVLSPNTFRKTKEGFRIVTQLEK